MPRLLPWIAAALIICGIEAGVYVVFRPNAVERSDFIVQPIQRFMSLLAERWIIWRKAAALTVSEPVAVHAGDSSGYFGVMPEVVSEYIGGRQILNMSCCANQGFHGYLAVLEHAVRNFPSIEYLIIYMSPVVAPSGTLWRGGEEIQIGAGQSMSVMGDALEENLTSFRRYLFPPSNMFRPAVMRDVFQGRLRAGLHPTQAPRIDTPVYNAASVFLERGGYMIEHDVQTNPSQCKTQLAIHARSGRSYFDLAMEEFVALGERYGVTPVVIFQPTACALGEGNRDLSDEVERLRRRYPKLKIPFDLVETWPANFFSVPAHVQRTIAIETSRRMGRALRDLREGKDRISFAPRRLNGGATSSTIHVVGATLTEMCGYDPLLKSGPYADISGVLIDRCEGRASCTYEKGSDAGDSPTPKGCKRVYQVSYQCTGGPVRTIREEGTDMPARELSIDCGAEAILADDPMPYGIQVVHATHGTDVGGILGNATIPVAALCDGRHECVYAVQNARLGDPAPGRAKKFEVWYRCDRELAPRYASIAAAMGNGELVSLSCDGSVAQARNPISVLEATYGASCGANPQNVLFLARSACSGADRCKFAIPLSLQAIASTSECTVPELTVNYTCGSGSKQSVRKRSFDGASPVVATLDCGGSSPGAEGERQPQH
jgi:hypothetical protein